MPKGRHRRHREARNLKTQRTESFPEDEAVVCEECGRRSHAEWCLAEAPDEYFE